MSLVNQKYDERVAAMTPMERVARADELLRWVRETLARQILVESGAMSDERLKWLVALRQYGAEPTVRVMIERMLDRVPN